MKHLTLLLLGVVLFLSACGGTTVPSIEHKQQSVKETTASNDYQETLNKAGLMEVPLLYVIDGDTIKVEFNGQEESVRFLLVDTPETSHPQLGKQPFGEDAKAFTKKLLSGKTVLLEKDISERDKYGRLLMYVYTADGKSVQEELLKNGLARVAYIYEPNTKYVDDYYEIQKEAQANGVGIWSVENYAQEDGYHTEALETEQSVDNPIPTKDAFEPDANGDCNGYIKGNDSSSGDFIYHVPEGSYYNRTKAEMCFKTETAAEEAGYRKAQK
ncbi:thermonuclease family protein [Salirhabdus sp. Marseille-P4669]|uniref:thermonuclease family protein n=1 Tax=Salirhabdus sp. Marseille-P4669 TaxID=2042310 RepID=UPI00135AA7F7|nr:thermonuclease family protein [Salirhabdus sp. Marseille-P4669]